MLRQAACARGRASRSQVGSDPLRLEPRLRLHRCEIGGMRTAFIDRRAAARSATPVTPLVRFCRKGGGAPTAKAEKTYPEGRWMTRIGRCSNVFMIRTVAAQLPIMMHRT